MIRKPKGPTARARAARRRKQLAAERAIKAQVRERDGLICRCCGSRLAESVHEIVPKSRGGKVSLGNSIHVCGLLVGASRSCHTYLQRHEIAVIPVTPEDTSPADANGRLLFVAKTPRARRWLDLPSEPGHAVLSYP